MNQMEQLEQLQHQPLELLNENQIMRIISALPADDPAAEEWKALAAAARYVRKQSMDERADAYLNDVFEHGEPSKNACITVQKLLARVFEHDWFTGGFPRIRETDHAQGKKKAAEKMKHQLEQALKTLQIFQSYQLKAESVCSIDDNTEEADKVKSVIKLMDEMPEAVRQAQDAAEEYSSSISGIYASKSAKAELDKKLQLVMKLADSWNSLYENYKNEQPDALMKLDAMTGLGSVKSRVKQLFYYLQFEQERERTGRYSTSTRSLHMILTGNPGTGKTTVARLLAGIYHQLGMLPKESVVEADRSRLVGAFVGQTEEKTRAVIEQASGGVLFIDEAHTLFRQDTSGSDYGQTAVDTLVAAMTSEEYAGTFAVILAGYEDDMRSFLEANPGLRSRFPQQNFIHLPDYSMDELIEIAEKTALDNDFILDEDSYPIIRQRLEEEMVDESFGNARTAEEIIRQAVFAQGAAAAEKQAFTEDNLAVLQPAYFKKSSETATQHPQTELNELIGLDDVKREVITLASFAQVQRRRREEGYASVPVELHSLFAGPPGTGKTTVASLFSQILGDLGFLKRGHLITAGRADLVAGYSGQTALKTKKVIKKALGGDLFIDEAYSLYRPGDDFGREAVDTLVEEMTKHGENLVVILAGYEEPLQQLLQSNPGLTSRFKKQILFPSYNTDELHRILLHHISRSGYEVNEKTKAALREVLKGKTFPGNARDMKDAVSEAVQQHAAAYLKHESRSINELVEADFIRLKEENR